MSACKTTLFMGHGVLYVVMALFLMSAAAAPAGAEMTEKYGTFNVLVENDRFTNTDRHYTHGTKLSYLSRANDLPQWAEGISPHLPLFANNGKKRIGYAIGQNIYTPENTQTRALIRDDRPYAGWLYGGVALLSDSDTRLDTYEVTLGMVGPASLAEQSQKFVHDVIDTTQPLGWDNQIDNEPAITIAYERKWRQFLAFSTSGLGVDFTPHVGATIGNVFTYGAAGFSVRMGMNLPADYGPPRIRPSLPGSSFFLETDGLGGYFFAGAEGRVMGRNIFLDGNTFSDSHEVDKKTLVADFQVGAAITYRRLRLALTHVFRTREFEHQSQADRFGAISLSAKF